MLTLTLIWSLERRLWCECGRDWGKGWSYSPSLQTSETHPRGSKHHWLEAFVIWSWKSVFYISQILRIANTLSLIISKTDFFSRQFSTYRVTIISENYIVHDIVLYCTYIQSFTWDRLRSCILVLTSSPLHKHRLRSCIIVLTSSPLH